MTAPERRRPLPALAFIGALTLLTALVWFRVIHRGDAGGASPSQCPSARTSAAVPALKVLPVPSHVSVVVLNSTQRDGIAKATRKVLEKRGFRVTQIGDDSTAYGGHGVIKGVAEIRFGPAATPAATLLTYFFPHATLVKSDSSSGVVTVSLGAEFKSVATMASARAALQRAHVKTSRTPPPTPAPSSSSSSSC